MMADADVNNVEDESSETENNILYELLTYAEWQQEPEILTKPTPEKFDDGRTTAGLWSWLGSLAASTSSVSTTLQKLRLHNMEWHIAVGSEGRVVAILQDQIVEIRSSKDEYASVIGRGSVSRDPFPQWRKVAWSPDCSFLAVTSSNGRIEFFDTVGSSLFVIPEKALSLDALIPEFGYAIAGMIFTEARVHKTQWSYEFIVVNYRGKLSSYLLSPSDGFRENHTFSLSNVYPRGVACIEYHPAHQILYVGSCPLVPTVGEDMEDFRTSTEVGVTAWRFLSDYPHYKLVTTLAEDVQGPRRFWQRMNLYYKNAHDMACKLSASPSGRTLAVAHLSGALSFWSLPALKHIHTWQLEDLPKYDQLNPNVHEPTKRKCLALRPEGTNFTICDMNWWSDKALIIGRYSGAVLVVSLQTKRNLLGESPEWFEFSPEVSGVFDRGFLTLECEWQLGSSKAVEAGMQDDGESSDDDTLSVGRRTSQMVRRALYYVTDSERFMPPRRMPKILTKLYRLLCLKSTTPEELFITKIDNEEYGEALALARTYSLDSDLVYQRQWRKSSASVASIHDYLGKITKCTWVLHECLERVPPTFDAARDLLEFGLRGTDVEALVAMGEGTYDGKFICHPPPIFENLYGNEHLSEFEIAEKQHAAEKKWRLEQLNTVDFSNLTLDQRWLCECRLKLLIYLDRLSIYQKNLGASLEHYDPAFFERFRSQPPLEAALMFAHEGNVPAVSALLTYAGDLTLPHWLTILSNFPETLSPHNYADLLPEAGWDKKDPNVFPWFQRELRGKDWCEEKCEQVPMMAVWESYNQEFYETNPSFKKWWTKSLTTDLLAEWYTERTHEIEEFSWLVENALELTKLGCMKHVRGLESLHDDLLTLETLVYECRLPKPIALRKLEKLSESEKMQLLMSMCTEAKYVLCVRDWLLPFVDRCEHACPGSRRRLLIEYFTGVAREDLWPCVQVFENSDIEDPNRILDGIAEVAELALECIYTCEREDQLDYVLRIIKCVPQRGAGGSSSKELQLLHDRLDVLEQYVEVAECVKRYGAHVTVKALNECEGSRTAVEALLKRIAACAIKRSPPMSESDWHQFLQDLLHFQLSVFKCITAMDCIQIVAHTLLRSGSHAYIKSAAELMTCTEEADQESPDAGSESSKLPHEISLKLALGAACEYVDSAASHTDPCLAFAKTCLLIMEGNNAEIRRELDFIEALPLLHQFKITTLPVQVRHQDKLDLIREALQLTPQSYRQQLKFLKLAALLHLHGDDKKKCRGTVLSLLADAAVVDCDYKLGYEICCKIVNEGHSEGWKICRMLGSCVEFENLEGRHKLLSFALCHCPDIAMESLLSAVQMTEVRQAYQCLDLPAEDWFNSFDAPKEKVSHSGRKGTPNQFGDSPAAIQDDKEGTWKLLGGTKTKAVLSSLSSTNFWKGTLKNLTTIGQRREHKEEKTKTSNSNLKRLGLPFLYSSLHDDVHVGKYDSSYEGYHLPERTVVLDDLFNVLRASLLCESLKSLHHTNKDVQDVCQSLLPSLAKAFISEDVLMCFGSLFAVNEVEQIEDFFLSLPNTPVVLQLASYFFALCALISLQPKQADTILHKEPADIHSEVEDQAFKVPEDKAYTRHCIDLAAKFHKMQVDLIQAKLLRERGGSVDVSRFAEDDRYKNETILGMALTTDEESLQVAVSLARRYNMPLWDVYACHLEFLFSEGCGVSYIEGRLQSTGMLKELMRDPEKLRQCLTFRVYQSLDGCEHSLMSFYYALLDKCGSNVTDMHGLKPRDHLQLLGKLKTLCSEIDYKALISPDGSPLDILDPFITAENVDSLAGIAPNIPSSEEGHLSASAIYCLWVSKQFLEKAKQHVMTAAGWSKHFEECRTYLSRLSPMHMVTFVESTALSRTALDCLNRRIRKDVVKQCLNMVKEKETKQQEHREQWKEASNTLQKYLAHLQKIEDGILDNVMDTTNPSIQPYAAEFELTRGITEKLEEMLLHCAMSDASSELLPSLLSCCPPNTVDKEAVDVYLDAVLLIAKQLRDPSPKLHKMFGQNEPEDVLEHVLQKASSACEDSLFSDLALDVLRPFCLDATISIKIRLNILEILERTVDLSGDDANLLLLLRLQALILTEWPDFDLDNRDVLDSTSRQRMFEQLLSQCHSVTQCTILGRVLTCGSPLPSFDLDEPEENPWSQLIAKVLGFGNEPSTLTAAYDLFTLAVQNCRLNLRCCQTVFCSIKDTGSVLHALKIAFYSDHREIHEKAVELLNSLDDVSEGSYDAEVLERILKLGLLPKIAPSLLYQPTTEYLIEHQDPTKEHLNVDTIVKQLIDAKMDPEAGTLLLQVRRTHPSLMTFSAALSTVGRWLKLQPPL
ncbi:NBAS subunit of NRZ tethering complex-like [Ornithodoros turicata]|uniref:NBAS subunit of NRZ tethering complex-like n=1 Tax=Ornithodoros turicata TaxID=34597 RepID=UPI0031388F58